MKTAGRMIAACLLMSVALGGSSASSQTSGTAKGDLMATESKAIGMLRNYASAEATYYAEHKRFATLAELIAVKYIAETYGSGSEHEGYRYTEVGIGKDTFDIAAEPVAPESGRYSFNVVEDYIIRFEKGAKAPKRMEGKLVGAAPFE